MNSPLVRSLVVPASMMDAVLNHLRAALPNEGCALIGGEIIGDRVVARKLYPGTNVDRSPRRFTMDAREVLTAWREIQDRGWVLAAIAHSHPNSPATPSPTDLAEAYYPDAVGLIVSWESDPPTTRAWSYVGHEPVEIALQIVDFPS